MMKTVTQPARSLDIWYDENSGPTCVVTGSGENDDPTCVVFRFGLMKTELHLRGHCILVDENDNPTYVVTGTGLMEIVNQPARSLDLG